MDHKRRLPPQAKPSKQSVSHRVGLGVRGGEGVDFAADKRGVGEGKGRGEEAGQAEEGGRLKSTPFLIVKIPLFITDFACRQRQNQWH